MTRSADGAGEELPACGLPERFLDNVRGAWGAAGDAWLAELPALLAKLAERWSLRLLPHCPNLAYNYVAPALTDGGQEVVLKAGLPRRELVTEIAALRLYDGRGAIRLLDADSEIGALLLERLRPGERLRSLGDDEAATVIAAGVMARLRRPAPAEHPFPTVFDWAKGFARLRARFRGETGPLPEVWLSRAEAVFAEFEQSPEGELVVLHGDLHHENILSARREPWLGLDPKGVVGERAYEAGALLRNPIPDVLDWPGFPAITARRIDQLAELLALDGRRIAAWGMAQAVLAAVWDFEEGATGGKWLAVAEACWAAAS